VLGDGEVGVDLGRGRGALGRHHVVDATGGLREVVGDEPLDVGAGLALTPPTVIPVAATHAVARATTLVLMSQRKGLLPFVLAARHRPPGRTSARNGRW
jgi:hypothetical protein